MNHFFRAKILIYKYVFGWIFEKVLDSTTCGVFVSEISVSEVVLSVLQEEKDGGRSTKKGG